MAQEFLKILYPSGAPSHQICDYVNVHKQGIWHQTVHVWIVVEPSTILFQKRSNTKENYPGLYDISCAGHVRDGETAVSAALRELKEELGFDAQKKDLELITSVKNQRVLNHGSYIDNEWAEVFILRAKTKPAFERPNDEVESIKFVNLSELRQVIKTQDAFYVPHQREYQILLNYFQPLN